MAKKKRGLDLPPAYEALKRAKELEHDAAGPEPLHTASRAVTSQPLDTVATQAAEKERRARNVAAEPAERDALGGPTLEPQASAEACRRPANAPKMDINIQSDNDEQPKAKTKAGKGAPVLPWMRLPVNIEPGAGVPLGDIKGLDPRLLASMQASAPASEISRKRLRFLRCLCS